MFGAAGPRRVGVVAAAVVGVVFVIGVVVANLGRGSSGGEPVDVEVERVELPMATHPAGPSTEVAGMAAGFTRDKAGAVAAAISYATASQRWLYFTDEEIEAAIHQIATPATASHLAAQVVAEVTLARDGLAASSGRVWWLVRPLAWEVELHTADEARVSIWTVTVLSATDVAAPQSEWMTLTVDLAWVDGDWRVVVIRDVPGPTPVVGPGDRPWDALPFDDALSGFTRMDGEPMQ